MAKVLHYISSRGLWLRTSFWNEGVPSYLDHFDINYIILRNFVNFKKKIFQITKYMEQRYWVFMNILFFEINISKLINYSTDMCWNHQGTMIHFFKGLMIENFVSKWRSTPPTLAALTLIILFKEMLKFSKNIYSESQNIVNKNIESLGIFYFMK
jgi:hypothetical protein